MQQDDRAGILLALAGFTLLSMGDAVIKTMAGQWSPLAVAALRFVLGAIGLSALLLVREGAAGFKPRNPWLQAARGLCLAGATTFFFAAIFVMPLAEAMALAFVSPVLVTVFGVVLLGERARPAVWVALAVALGGVALVLRPNLAVLGWTALLPLISALFFSLMIIANRASAGQGSALSMQAFVAIVAAPVLVTLALLGDRSGEPLLAAGWPDWSVAARCALVAGTASTAHWLVYRGTMRAGASTIAPTTYVQMLVATALGWWWFGDVPDLATMAGATIIVAAGLYLWWTTPPSQPATVVELD